MDECPSCGGEMVRAMLEERGGPLPRCFGLPIGCGLVVSHDGSVEPVGGRLFEL